ncbi:hypothetical protein ACFOHW_25345 [Paenibacillus abyssi]
MNEKIDWLATWMVEREASDFIMLAKEWGIDIKTLYGMFGELKVPIESVAEKRRILLHQLGLKVHQSPVKVAPGEEGRNAGKRFYGMTGTCSQVYAEREIELISQIVQLVPGTFRVNIKISEKRSAGGIHT